MQECPHENKRGGVWTCMEHKKEKLMLDLSWTWARGLWISTSIWWCVLAAICLSLFGVNTLTWPSKLGLVNTALSQTNWEVAFLVSEIRMVSSGLEFISLEMWFCVKWLIQFVRKLWNACFNSFMITSFLAASFKLGRIWISFEFW